MKRRERSATFWKILVAATSGAALSAILVATCLDSGEARRERDREREEPAVVQTTAAMVPSNAELTATATTTAKPPTTTIIVERPVAAPASPPAEELQPTATPRTAFTSAQPTYTPAEVSASVAPPAAEIAPAVAAANDVPQPVYGGVTAAPAPQPRVLRDPRGNLVDPDDHGSNPNAPAMSAGAGQFITDAPPWSASSFQSDPNAGAGPFTTEWNIPGYGYWPY